MTKIVNVEGIGEMIVGFTDDDIKRMMQDGYIAIRDDADHLLMYYNPTKNLIEVKRRGRTTIIDLDKYRVSYEHEKVREMNRNQVAFWNMISTHHDTSAASAASQAAQRGRLPNE